MSHVKRVTLSIVPGESCGLQTPVILMARLLFHGCGDKSRRVPPPPHRAGLDQGGRSGEAGRSITFYIVLIMSDVCGGGGGERAFITASEVYGERTGQGVGPGDRRLH